MWTCPKCKIDVEPSFDGCWSCGTSRDGEQIPGFEPEAEGIMRAEAYEAETEARKHESFVTIATFWQPAEALVARTTLEGEGIHAYLADEQTVAMDWLLANAIGGVKLQVAEHDLERALEVLDAAAQRQADRVAPDQRVIAQAVKEGVQTEPSPPAQATAGEEVEEPRDSPGQLINYAYRAAIFGLILLILPIHVYSLSLLLKARSMPGELPPLAKRRFRIALLIDLLVIILLWVPLTLLLLYFFVDALFGL